MIQFCQSPCFIQTDICMFYIFPLYSLNCQLLKIIFSQLDQKVYRDKEVKQLRTALVPAGAQPVHAHLDKLLDKKAIELEAESYSDEGGMYYAFEQLHTDLKVAQRLRAWSICTNISNINSNLTDRRAMAQRFQVFYLLLYHQITKNNKDFLIKNENFNIQLNISDL